jgi:hypothetical protein
MLICDGVSFSLNEFTSGLSLSVGSINDNQLALAAVAKFSRSVHLNPHPRIPPNVSSRRRLREIRAPRVWFESKSRSDGVTAVP